MYSAATIKNGQSTTVTKKTLVGQSDTLIAGWFTQVKVVLEKQKADARETMDKWRMAQDGTYHIFDNDRFRIVNEKLVPTFLRVRNADIPSLSQHICNANMVFHNFFKFQKYHCQ